MKYCSKCGTELFDDAVICLKCGCPAESNIQFSPQAPTYPVQEKGDTTAAKVFMIIGTVFWAIIFPLTLAWCLPMTLSYCGKVKCGKPISTGFKVCTLLFVNLIAGILMLCDNNN